MTSILSIQSGGVPFTVRLLRRGDRYGRNFCIVYDEADPSFRASDPLVEFYDARQSDTEFGRFVSRYYASTLLQHPQNTGLCLAGDVKAWSIDTRAFKIVREWLLEQLKGEGST